MNQVIFIFKNQKISKNILKYNFLNKILGGPHVYSRLEVYEILHNIVGTPPKLAYFPRNLALTLTQRFHNWQYFNLETVLKNDIDIVVNKGAKTISDLYVRPVSFPQGVEPLLQDKKSRHMTGRDYMEK